MKRLKPKLYTISLTDNYVGVRSYLSYRCATLPTPLHVSPQIVHTIPFLIRRLARAFRATVLRFVPTVVLGALVSLKVGTQVECHWVDACSAFEPSIVLAVAVVGELPRGAEGCVAGLAEEVGRGGWPGF